MSRLLLPTILKEEYIMFIFHNYNSDYRTLNIGSEITKIGVSGSNYHWICLSIKGLDGKMYYTVFSVDKDLSKMYLNSLENQFKILQRIIREVTDSNDLFLEDRLTEIVNSELANL